MRTNNGKVKNIIISVYFILIVLAVILSILFNVLDDLFESAFLATIALLVSITALLFIVHHISKYFEYDSDGIKVVLINKGLLLADFFNYREHVLEFSKEQLVGYKLKNYIIYKELVLFIKSQNRATKKEHFNVSLVSKKKLKYIKQSLSKMIKQNRKK